MGSAPRRGVESIDPIDESCIRPRIRFDQQPLHVRADALREGSNSGSVIGAGWRGEFGRSERRSVRHGDTRSKRRLSIEVQSHGDERDSGAGPLGGQHDARRSRAQRRQTSLRVAHAFWKNAHRVAGAKGRVDSAEHFRVARHVHTFIPPPVDRDRARTCEERLERAVEQRGFGEEADVAAGGGPDDRRVEQRVGVIGDEQ